VSFQSDAWCGNARINRAVFIGKSLDGSAIKAAFLDCCAEDDADPFEASNESPHTNG
jgi:hypothetical protein